MSTFKEEFESCHQHYRLPRGVLVSLAERHTAGFIRLDGQPILKADRINEADEKFQNHHAQQLQAHPDFNGLSPEETQEKYETALKYAFSRSRLFKRAPIHVVDGILGDGVFRNQFETGRTKGSLQHPGEERWQMEGHHFDGLSDDPTEGAVSRPTYGYASHTPFNTGSSGYGDAIFEFDPKVRAHTSITFGDSLSTHNDRNFVASMINAPHGLTVPVEHTMNYLNQIGMFHNGNATTLKHWVPGAFDSPDAWIKPHFHHAMLDPYLNKVKDYEDDLRNVEPFTRELRPTGWNQYIEAQFHRKLSPFEHVKHVYLPDDSSEYNSGGHQGELLDKLKNYGIPVKIYHKDN